MYVCMYVKYVCMYVCMYVCTVLEQVMCPIRSSLLLVKSHSLGTLRSNWSRCLDIAIRWFMICPRADMPADPMLSSSAAGVGQPVQPSPAPTSKCVDPHDCCQNSRWLSTAASDTRCKDATWARKSRSHVSTPVGHWVERECTSTIEVVTGEPVVSTYLSALPPV